YLNEVIVHPPGKEIEVLQQHLPRLAELAKQGKQGALFVGSQYLENPQRRAIVSELLKYNSPQLFLNLMEGRGNSMVARVAGMRPEFGPFGKAVNPPGMNALQVLEKTAQEGWDYLHVAGANPALQFPSKLWKEA